ncbi:MAG: 50S ribosomal protein L20 [Deltaproteobacteria bacterium]|nr:50S ribosomal protein L20 [Deltaproteobacteria bacterium]
MARVKRGYKARRRRNKVLAQASGYFGGRSRLIRTAQEAVDRALAYAYRDRRTHKRTMRGLWQIRIGAAVKPLNTSYSRFMHGLKQAGVTLDRKVLAELAVAHPQDFAHLVKTITE